MRTIATAAIAGVALLLTACGASPAPAELTPTVTVTATATVTSMPTAAPTVTSTPTAAPTLWRYGDLRTLRISLQAIGYDCPAWETGDWMPLAVEAGTCGDDAMGMYAHPDTLARGVAAERIVAPDAPMVYGDDWLLLPREGADCELLARQLVGVCDRG